TSAEMYQMAAQNVHTDNLIDYTGPSAVFPTVFKTFSLNANDLVYWVPALGKTIQLLGGLLVFSADSPTAGSVYVQLQDSTQTLLTIYYTEGVVPFSFPGAGYTLAKSDALAVQYNNAPSGGRLTVSLWGNEI